MSLSPFKLPTPKPMDVVHSSLVTKLTSMLDSYPGKFQNTINDILPPDVAKSLSAHFLSAMKTKEIRR